jgi:hypothetical protein
MHLQIVLLHYYYMQLESAACFDPFRIITMEMAIEVLCVSTLGNESHVYTNYSSTLSVHSKSNSEKHGE